MCTKIFSTVEFKLDLLTKGFWIVSKKDDLQNFSLLRASSIVWGKWNLTIMTNSNFENDFQLSTALSFQLFIGKINIWQWGLCISYFLRKFKVLLVGSFVIDTSIRENEPWEH